ncbi:hypothetical protein HOO69_03875 [Vibrio europaeus]|uniref:Uncharacterized protein n=1 Tax=Vibrio europaeus TaxID=300876 RepID=A0AAE7DWI1_9VIBR|nr:hypothetical protein [Vibrio europaeus]QJY35796.1 hypothetical protein HOO69_03875 [Vibrio europaeus]
MDSSKAIYSSSHSLSWLNKKPSGELFFEWNLRILISFFSKASENEEVFLRVDSDFFDQIGQDIGGDAGFVNAVKQGPSSVKTQDGLADKATELCNQRLLKATGYEDPGELDSSYLNVRAPTYLPYLAALVRNFTKSNTKFYFNLKNELNLEEDFSSPDMAKLEILWEDLCTWTSTQKGKFGFFKKRTLGGYRHIGLPAAQSIVKQTDLNSLLLCFVHLQLKTGEELSDRRLQEVINYIGSLDNYFSAGFHEALHDREFRQPICEIIRYVFSDWDGSLPKKEREISGSASYKDEFELGISLMVNNTQPPSFSPCWFIPPLQDEGNFLLQNGKHSWSGRFSGTNGVSCSREVAIEQKIWDLTGEIRSTPLNFELECSGADDTKPSKTSLQLPTSGLWVLTWSQDQLSGVPQLVPSDLPAHGPAYLLASPSQAGKLVEYLELQKPDAEFMQDYGVPANWKMLFIKDCSNLTSKQRHLPDGSGQPRPRPRVIRFTGGRTVQRGYKRMYLPYDLPSIELDAAANVRLVASDGVAIEEQFHELDKSYQEESLFHGIKFTRTFALRLLKAKSANYRIRALDLKGSELASVQLKVAGVNGDLVEVKDNFSLDKFGKTQATSSGLVGVELNLPSIGLLSSNGQATSVSVQELGNDTSFLIEDACLFRKFLDTLAQSGSLDFGTAKNVLRRQIQASTVELQPIFILLELQRLGHLELSTTLKGNTARVHAIPPRFYNLPVDCSGHTVWGISGTLRLEHWESIAEAQSAWKLISVSSTSGMNNWRLVIKDNNNAQDIVKKLELDVVDMAALTIADYSGDVTEFHDNTFRNPIESIGGPEDQSHRFMASEGYFVKEPTGKIKTIGELWKLQDLDIRFDNVHVLVKDGQYAFVRDSSWGKWLAIHEFAGFLRELPGFDSELEVPINYQKQTGKVWIPARIGFPRILERALVVCSATAPSVVPLMKVNEDLLSNEMILADSQAEVLRSSNFYSGMSDGKWLVYEHVPESVAKAVASKLGATLYVCN